MSEPGQVVRRTQTIDGRVVEAFVHTPGSLMEFIDREVLTRRSPLLHMCAEGTLLLDHEGLGSRVQAEAGRRLLDGPPALTDVEDEDRRYVITDLLDDLASSPDPAELAFILGRLIPLLAELVLLQDRQWISSGKWLLRRLHAWAPDTADTLVEAWRRSLANDDPGPALHAGTALLSVRGGRVQDGYERVASRVAAAGQG